MKKKWKNEKKGKINPFFYFIFLNLLLKYINKMYKNIINYSNKKPKLTNEINEYIKYLLYNKY